MSDVTVSRHRREVGSVRRLCALLLGGVALSGAPVALTAGMAYAEDCGVTPSRAECRSSVGSTASAESSTTRTGVGVNPFDEDRPPFAPDGGPGSHSQAVGGGSVAAAVTDLEGGQANSSADGALSGATSAAVDQGNADARARGRKSLSSAAAATNSKADARADGENATSGAAAGDHSTAMSRAYGKNSHSRAAAIHNDQAYALAGPHSSADIGPGKAQCAGLGIGIEFRTRSACLGPLATPSSADAGSPRPAADHPEHGAKTFRDGHGWASERD